MTYFMDEIQGRLHLGTVINHIEIPAAFLGAWISFQVSDDVYSQIALHGSEKYSEIPFGLPGMTLIDGRKGWTYSKDTKKVIVGKPGPILALDPIKLRTQKGRLCMALIRDVPHIAPEFNMHLKSFGTTATRLEVGTVTRTITLVGDVFVQPTARGYAPAMHAKLPSGQLVFFYVAAKSLSNPLEEIRSRIGTLDGTKIKIRKLSDEKMAPYEISIDAEVL